MPAANTTTTNATIDVNVGANARMQQGEDVSKKFASSSLTTAPKPSSPPLTSSLSPASTPATISRAATKASKVFNTETIKTVAVDGVALPLASAAASTTLNALKHQTETNKSTTATPSPPSPSPPTPSATFTVNSENQTRELTRVVEEGTVRPDARTAALPVKRKVNFSIAITKPKKAVITGSVIKDPSKYTLATSKSHLGADSKSKSILKVKRVVVVKPKGGGKKRKLKVVRQGAAAEAEAAALHAIEKQFAREPAKAEVGHEVDSVHIATPLRKDISRAALIVASARGSTAVNKDTPAIRRSDTIGHYSTSGVRIIASPSAHIPPIRRYSPIVTTSEFYSSAPKGTIYNRKFSRSSIEDCTTLSPYSANVQDTKAPAVTMADNDQDPEDPNVPSSSNNPARKRKINEENTAKSSSEAASAADPSTSTEPAEEDKDKEEDKDAKKKKNRCAECRKKVGLTGFQCRCGGLYCAVHRYSDKHDCTFNYREHGAQEIRRNNPVVVGEKIQKI